MLFLHGIDVTTGLAALGIGGIALALGAQKAIENLLETGWMKVQCNNNRIVL